MDFRLLEKIVIFMKDIGYSNSYDHFILAGASLAYVVDQFKSWRKIGKEHLDIAVKLHKIKEIICIDHEQCGAYRMCYPDLNAETEKQKHEENVIIFEKKLGKSHPELTLHAYYMHLDGTTEKIN